MSTLYIGMDVHKETITVAVAEEGRNGEIRPHAWVRGPRAHAVGVATGNPLNSLIFSIGWPSEDSKIIDTRLFS